MHAQVEIVKLFIQLKTIKMSQDTKNKVVYV